MKTGTKVHIILITVFATAISLLVFQPNVFFGIVALVIIGGLLLGVYMILYDFVMEIINKKKGS